MIVPGRVCEIRVKRDPSVIRSKGGHKQCSGLQHVLQILQQCRVFIFIVLLTDPIRGAG